MSVLEIPTYDGGHDVIEFDRTVGADHPKVKEAMEAFNKLVGEGHVMATKSGSSDATIVKNFSQVGDKTFAIKQLQGG